MSAVRPASTSAPAGRMRRVGRRMLMLAAVAAGLPSLIILLYSVIDPPLTPLMVLRRVQGETLSYRWRPLARISPHLRKAVIASEDNLFCRHFGFDTEALSGQIKALVAGERVRGASTITMQTAKNILLWPGRDPLRKAVEAWMTPQIEMMWSKQRILEVYLNIIETGPGIYGAEAAARRYFSKSADRLSSWESALIAAALPSPRASSPDRPDSRLRRKARIIHNRISQLGHLGDCAGG